MKITTTLLSLLIGSTSFGQTFSTTILDQNNVSAIITDGGILFNDQATSIAGYEVPAGQGTTAIYAASMWFGGIDGSGQLRLSGASYQNSLDIFPGPYTSDTAQYSSASYSTQYGTSLWSVTKVEIDDHIQNWNQPGYVIPSSLLNWPGNGDISLGVSDQLAPYVDMNGNDIYEPQLGDYPNIRGDKAVYVIMNDSRYPHTGSNGEPLHIEVHQMIYQYSTNDYLNDLTFINTRVFNRGGYTYSNFKTSFYTDGDLGNYMDDYVGCDSLRNMVFTYNGDALDENNGGAPGFGADPPAIGIMSLNTPMTSATYYTNAVGYPQTDPNNAIEYWNYMNGLWADGTPMYFGGTGFPGSSGSTTTTTNYMYSGDPLEIAAGPTLWEWNEINPDNSYNANPSGDRRMVMSLDSAYFAPGDQICYDYVIVFGPGTPGTFPSGISSLQQRADSVQIWYDNQNFDCQQVTLSLTENTIANTIVYPNPSSGEFNVELGDDLGELTLTVFDLQGRIVFNEKYLTNNITFGLNEKPGTYLLQIQSASGMHTERIVIK